MYKLLESRYFSIISCVFFTCLAIAWVLFSKPLFPGYSVISLSLPYRFPILGFVPAFWLLYAKQKKLALVWSFLLLPFFFLTNLNMLRPDLYMLWLILLLVAIAEDKSQVYSSIWFIFAAMYFWTAIQKLNFSFFDGMANSFAHRIIPAYYPVWVSKALAFLVPFLELGLAFLCLGPYQKWRRGVAVLLHAGILYYIIIGNWNATMIPWNVALLASHLILPSFEWRKGRFALKKCGLPLGLAWIIPAFYFVNLAPVFASWAMYSARIQPYYLEIDQEVALNPPSEIRDFVFRKDGAYVVSVFGWSDFETGGPPCVEPWAKEGLFKRCEKYLNNEN